MRRSRNRLVGWMGYLLLGVAGVAVAAVGAVAAEKPITLVLAHSATPDNSLAMGYARFAELVKERSGGRVLIEVHGSGILAGDQTAVEGVRLGNFDMGSCASNLIAPFTDAFLWADLPYIFDSIESSRKVWDGPIGEVLRARVEKELGLKILMYMNTGGGFRTVTNNARPLHTPKDVAGLKLMSTASPLHVAILRAWGASPTTMPWPEVYTALQQRIVVGEHLHYVWIYFSKHYEALKYATEVGALANVHIGFIGMKSWAKLSPDLQQVVLKAAKDAEIYNNKVDAEKGLEAKQKLIQAGMQTYVPTPEEMKQWRDKAMVVYDEFKDKIPQDLIRRIRETQRGQ